MQMRMRNVVRVLKFGAKVAVAVAAVALAVGAGKNVVYADDVVTSGTSYGIDWEYSNGTLTITPSSEYIQKYGEDAAGEMADYEPEAVTGGEHAAPWSGFYADVTDVVIKSGVWRISRNAFSGTSSNMKKLNSVTIGEDVDSVDATAFNYVEIGTLTIYSNELNMKAVESAFMSINEDGHAYLSVSEVNTKNENMINYFKRYSEGSESVWFYGLGLDVRDGVPVDKSDVKINPFEINFVNDNLLDEGSKAYYKGDDDEDFTEVEYKTEDSLSESFQSAYKVFKDNNYDVDNRIKLFDVSSSNEMIETAQIKVPIPSAWKSKADSIKVLTYTNENGSAKISEVDCTADNGYIIFTAPHFSPYALYYTAAEETTTTAASTTATTTATTAATTTTTTVAANTTNAITTAAATSNAATTTTTASKTVSSGKNSGSGTRDNTPDTGVKDFMWIAVPVAVMLMGVGIVVLAMRKRKTLDK
jgi:hypothetical protein